MSEKEYRSVGRSTGTKRCPRCGEVLFSDMSVCYGCLYNFERNDKESSVGLLVPDDWDAGLPPLELSEEEPYCGQTSFEVVESKDDDASWSDGLLPVGVGPSASDNDTGSFGSDWREGHSSAASMEYLPAKARGNAADVGNVCVGRVSLGLRVCDAALEVVVPLVPGGITIGRGDDCDIVLHAPSVSRRHVRVELDAKGALVRDLGATNRAKLDGSEVTDSKDMPVGSALDVCGTLLTLVRM